MGRTMTEYFGLTAEEMDQRIHRVKEKMGKRLVILGHHYQKDDVIQHADYRGDSLRLAQLAAQEKEAEVIVFCGVHFMAETADIQTSAQQKVVLPDLLAGCTMADMANLEEVEQCWEILRERYGDIFLPVTYVNSSADIKAFCGRHGGLTCTSGNADKIFQHVYRTNKAMLFIPDEHLGRNTGLKFGIKPEEILVWDPAQPEMKLPSETPRLVAWKGFCCVHQRFTPEHIRQMRARYPEIRVIVHPECPHEIVELADDSGSTDYILRKVAESPEGSAWAIGTEANLVNRLAKENPGKTILSLDPGMSYCKSMNLLNEAVLLWALENIAEGNIVNQVEVDSKTKKFAALAVQRMLDL